MPNTVIFLVKVRVHLPVS